MTPLTRTRLYGKPARAVSANKRLQPNVPIIGGFAWNVIGKNSRPETPKRRMVTSPGVIPSTIARRETRACTPQMIAHMQPRKHPYKYVLLLSRFFELIRVPPTQRLHVRLVVRRNSLTRKNVIRTSPTSKTANAAEPRGDIGMCVLKDITTLFRWEKQVSRH